MTRFVSIPKKVQVVTEKWDGDYTISLSSEELEALTCMMYCCLKSSGDPENPLRQIYKDFQIYAGEYKKNWRKWVYRTGGNM